MTVTAVVESSFEEKYQQARQNFLNHINDNSQTIILYGPGGNGKSHLTQELNYILNYQEYVIYSSDETYSWNKNQFIVNLDNPEKKIIHLLFDPFDHWNIVENDNYEINVGLVDMSNMKW
jgi:chromosomal replication initiation ATPase DnaA